VSLCGGFRGLAMSFEEARMSRLRERCAGGHGISTRLWCACRLPWRSSNARRHAGGRAFAMSLSERGHVLRQSEPGLSLPLLPSSGWPN
jgi:hypothetical protein